MIDESEPDHELARDLVARLNEATNTEGVCLGTERWGCSVSHRLRYCEQESRTCVCCDRHACEAGR